MKKDLSDTPVAVWIDDSVAREWVFHRLIQKVVEEVENRFEIALFGDTDEAIDFTLKNYSRVFMFIQDSTRGPGRIIPAWKALRPTTSPLIGYGGHQGEFYTYVIDAFAPEASTVFAGFSFTTEERGLISDWALRDSRILLANKFKFSRFTNEEENLASITTERLNWWSNKPNTILSKDSQLLQPLANELAVLCGARPDYIDSLTPRQFEELTAALFKNHGFQIELTARTRDGGYDIIAVSNSHLDSEVILIEVKHYAPNRPVGVGIVRALYGVKVLKSASRAILVTSSYVSKDARREFSRVIPWELDFVERANVLDWCKSYLAEILKEPEQG